jgi:hypothetical protein
MDTSMPTDDAAADYSRASLEVMSQGVRLAERR